MALAPSQLSQDGSSQATADFTTEAPKHFPIHLETAIFLDLLCRELAVSENTGVAEGSKTQLLHTAALGV